MIRCPSALRLTLAAATATAMFTTVAVLWGSGTQALGAARSTHHSSPAPTAAPSRHEQGSPTPAPTSTPSGSPTPSSPAPPSSAAPTPTASATTSPTALASPSPQPSVRQTTSPAGRRGTAADPRAARSRLGASSPAGPVVPAVGGSGASLTAGTESSQAADPRPATTSSPKPAPLRRPRSLAQLLGGPHAGLSADVAPWLLVSTGIGVSMAGALGVQAYRRRVSVPPPVPPRLPSAGSA